MNIYLLSCGDISIFLNSRHRRLQYSTATSHKFTKVNVNTYENKKKFKYSLVDLQKLNLRRSIYKEINCNVLLTNY